MPEDANSHDQLEVRRRRARYRAGHRGTKELDLILGSFADAHVDGYNDEQLYLFETLLDNEEMPLQRILLGQDAAPADELGALLTSIRAFQIVHATSKNPDSC